MSLGIACIGLCPPCQGLSSFCFVPCLCGFVRFCHLSLGFVTPVAVLLRSIAPDPSTPGLGGSQRSGACWLREGSCGVKRGERPHDQRESLQLPPSS